MKNIALGQYYPSGSILHKLDPRMKIILALIYIVCTFLCRSTLSFALLLAVSLILPLVGKIAPRIIFGSIKGLLIVLLFTGVLKLFMTHGTAENLLVDVGFIHIYKEGIYESIFIVIRIVALVIGSSVLISFTTTPIMLTDGIESLLSPLKKVKAPVHEFAMISSIALRFVPLIMEDAEKITTAQRSRGVDFSGGLIKKAKAFIPIILPLLLSSIRRGVDLATAMECRCYRGGEGRTKFHAPKTEARDFVALFVIVVFVFAIIALNRVKFGYTM